MMGRTHATSGMVLALVAAPALERFGVPADPGSILVMTVAAAGGAMLPDFDHRHATLSRALGPITALIAMVIEGISGGHRHGTHSLLGIGAFTAFTWWMVQLGSWPLGLWCGLLLAAGSSGLQVTFTKGSTILHTLICLIGGALLVHAAVRDLIPFDLVIWGVAIGATAHIAGDLLTEQGCPLLWPALPTRFKVANLTTDHFTERVIIGPALGVAALVLLWQIGGLSSPGWSALTDLLSV